MAYYEISPPYRGLDSEVFYEDFSRTYNIYPPLPSTSSLTTTVLEAEPVGSSRNLTTQDPNTRPKAFSSNFKESVFIFTVMIATGSTNFLQGAIIINTAKIGRRFQMTPAEIAWVGAAVGLGSGAFMLLFGKTADLLAFAPNAISMNVLCGFLGLGTAVISPPAMGAVFATYPEGKRRDKITGAIGSGNPVGFILGSMSSGIATTFVDWEASFIVITVFFSVTTILAFWSMPTTRRAENVRSIIRQFDYLGTGLIIVGLILSATALTEGPEMGWKSPTVIILLVFGLLCLFGFALWERLYTYPLLNPIIWQNRNYTACVLCVLFGYMSFITNQFWICLYMQDIQKLTPLRTAVWLLPSALAGIICGFVGQALVSRVTGTSIMAIGSAAYLSSAILLFYVKQYTSYWVLLFPSMVISVIGAAFQFIVANLYVTKQMRAQSSLAVGVLQTVMRFSICIGLSISTAVYTSSSSKTRSKLDPVLPFERAYLCSIIYAIVGFACVPFLRIGIQGRETTPQAIQIPSAESVEDRPNSDSAIDFQHSMMSYGSTLPASGASYLPPWSWEAEGDWITGLPPAKRWNDNVLYEVCIKCLAEREVALNGRLSTIATSSADDSRLL